MTKRWLRHLALALTGAAAACGPIHPTDAELLRRFSAHGTEFARLIAMSDADPHVIRIAPNFTRLDTNWGWPRSDSLLGISHARWDEYRELFRSTGLMAGLQRDSLDGGTVVIFTASTQGIVGRGSAKGYAYSRHPLTPVYPSLDSFRKESAHGYAFRSIGRGWYLEYDW